MDWIRSMVQWGLGRIDGYYQRANDLQAVGPVLYLGRARYQGPAIRFEDDTPLDSGDEVGILHFNNIRFSQMESGTSAAAALGFARLMLESMHDLAERAFQDPAFCNLAVFHAVSWLPAHGQRIGFVTKPFPFGWKRRLLIVWFQLLVWAFAPARQSRRARPDPHFYWLTRKSLLQQFAGNKRRHRHAPARPV
ncbi:MAG TPA: hypothetical protein VEW72_01960 [Burkholderiales bacterium]|nr:hypothetical protein [Burkholderiales bacterium]